jgi:non-canonical poly(A) RNA polymerase PAPD5/7
MNSPQTRRRWRKAEHVRGLTRAWHAGFRGGACPRTIVNPATSSVTFSLNNQSAMSNRWNSYKPGGLEEDSYSGRDRRFRSPRRSRSPRYSRSPRRSRSPYRFGRDEYRPARDEYRPRDERSYRDDYREDQRSEFTFRSEQQAQFPQNEQHFERRQHERGRGRGRGGRQRQERKPWVPKAAVNREILHAKVDGQTTPERLNGMSEGTNRFRNLDELSESSSDMDITSGSEDSNDEANSENAPPGKRTKQSAANDGDSVPKWSNPDPYTVLPPVNEPRGKKTDVVEFIRKVKLAAEKEKKSDERNDVTDNVDFISFGMDDDESIAPSEKTSKKVAQPISGAITGSLNDIPENVPLSIMPTKSFGVKPFSHLANLHSEHPLVNSNNSANLVDSHDISRHSALAPGSTTQNSSVSLPVVPPPRPEANFLPTQAQPLQRRRPQPKNQKRKRQIDGEIEPDWIALDQSSATPWCTIDHSATEHMGDW